MKTGLKPLIAPSILSADFARLGEEIRDVEAAGADWIHVDVMDGHFVPNLTIGPVVVESLRSITKLELDCHLMVSRPSQWIEAFAKAGADTITIHAEATKSLKDDLALIRKLGKKAGVSINPDTSVETIEPLLSAVDLVLVMSVFPGFAGQKFMPEVLEKSKRLSVLRGNLPYRIEIDGGINAQTIQQARSAGCDVFVAGSSVFSKSDRKQAIHELRQHL